MLAQWMIPVMNVALVLANGALIPFALGVRAAWGGLLALGVTAALILPSGALAAMALLPWLGLGIAVGVQALGQRDVARAAVAGFSVTAALALIASRLEVTVFSIPEPIVKLTALHFTFAGVGTLSLARLLGGSRRVCLVILAPPIVATGFITRLALFQVGGALVMTAAAWWVALGQVQLAWREQRRRALFALSSACPLVAMVLGVTWAANQYWPSVPALSVVDMVPTHGALNAFGFIGLGHLAWWLRARQP